MRAAIERTWQRVRNAIGIGAIRAVDDSGPVQMAQVQIGWKELRDQTPVLYHFGYTANPPVGTDAALNFGDGDRSRGMVVASNNQPVRPKGLLAGEVMIYDNAGNHVYLRQGGIIEVIAATKVRLVTPRLEVTGDVIDHCDDGAGRTMAQMRTFDKTHLHPGVSSGSAHTQASDTPE